MIEEVIIQSEPGETITVAETTEIIEMQESSEVIETLYGIAIPNVSSGSGIEVVLTAAEALSGQRIITTNSSGDAIYASNDDISNLNGPFFLTTAAESFGAQFAPLVIGTWTEPGWSWTPLSYIYLGVNGMLTDVEPSSAVFVLVAGVALTPTTIFFNPRSPIKIN